MTQEEKILLEIAEIKKLLTGNGKIGVAEMARRAFDYYQKLTSSKESRIEIAYKAIILTGIGYIAARMGG